MLNMDHNNLITYLLKGKDLGIGVEIFLKVTIIRGLFIDVASLHSYTYF